MQVSLPLPCFFLLAPVFFLALFGRLNPCKSDLFKHQLWTKILWHSIQDEDLIRKRPRRRQGQDLPLVPQDAGLICYTAQARIVSSDPLINPGPAVELKDSRAKIQWLRLRVSLQDYVFRLEEPYVARKVNRNSRRAVERCELRKTASYAVLVGRYSAVHRLESWECS